MSNDAAIIPIEKIVVDDLRPESKIRQRSFAATGNVQPIYVNSVNGHFELVDGRGRLADLMAGGATHVKAIIEKDMSATRRAIVGLTLNLGRSDNPMNEAEMIESLLNAGMKIGEIAEAVGAKQPVVSQRKALLKLIPELRRALKSGDMPFTAGRYACKWTEGEQREFFEAGDLTVKAAKEFMTELQAGAVSLDDLGLPDLDNQPAPGLFLSGDDVARLTTGQTVTVVYQGQAITLSASGNAATAGDSS